MEQFLGDEHQPGTAHQFGCPCPNQFLWVSLTLTYVLLFQPHNTYKRRKMRLIDIQKQQNSNVHNASSKKEQYWGYNQYELPKTQVILELSH